MGTEKLEENYVPVEGNTPNEESRQENTRPSTYAPYDGEVPPPSDDDDRPKLSPSTICFLTVGCVLLLAGTASSPRPWYTLLFVSLAILPALPVARFILRNFQDPVIRKPFLLSQFLLGAFPLVILASPVEVISSGLLALAVFSSELGDARDKLESLQTGEDDPEALLNALKDIVPFWKILLYFLLVAFITAGMVEEVGKWLIARRYRILRDLQQEGSPRMGCRGILASACAGALGFAMTENMLYVLGLARATPSGFSFGLVGLALLRGMLAYPVHVGTQFYVGVTAAQRDVLADRVSIGLALLVAVLFHGFFDAVAFTCMVLIGLKHIPEWVGGLVPVFDIVLVGFLLLLCRSRYKALLERERMTIGPEPV